jgi:acetyl esterase/lipase
MARYDFHPDLRTARYLPGAVPVQRGLFRRLSRLGGSRPPSGGAIERIDADVSVRIWRPESAIARTAASPRPLPALLWIHGGGYVIGNAAMSDDWCRLVSERLGVVAASVEYRLAPEHRFPVPLEDCYTALHWLANQADVDPTRIAIGGESAGGGLAAALALLAKERGKVRPVLQVLSYPMIDDRTTARTDVDPRSLRMWSTANNRFGWRAYLGPAHDDPPPLAAPARYDDLLGVAPAWIGTGTRDLFHDENVTYAERLRAAGVPCDLHLVPGAYHGFDLVERKAVVAREYQESQVAAIERALGGGEGG